MKRAIFLVVVLLMAFSVMPASANDKNGLDVNGPHYNLNIIGVDNPKNADMNCGNGGRIFVSLTGSSKINLTEGTPYAVLDCTATSSSDAAEFQLPNPDPDGDGTTVYSVYARALGQPNNSSTTTTCGIVKATGEEVCSIYQMLLVRSKGQSLWDNVSKELLYVYYDINGDGTVERVPLFDKRMQGFFWDYDNNGLKLAQLRFYEVPTTVPAP